MSAASAKTPAASASPLGVSPSSATTITGTARMRSSVSTFGTFSGNIATPVSRLVEPSASTRALTKTSSSIASVSVPVNVFCCDGW